MENHTESRQVMCIAISDSVNAAREATDVSCKKETGQNSRCSRSLSVLTITVGAPSRMISIGGGGMARFGGEA